MMNQSMSRSTAPIILGVGLALAASAAPAAGQRAETIARSAPRAPMSDSIAARMRQLERSIDSLVRAFGDDDLSSEQRFGIRRQLDERVWEAAKLRAADPRFRERNVFIRVPEPGFDERMKALDAARPRMAVASLVPGWIGIVVIDAPTEMRIENNEMHLRYLLYPQIASVDPSSPAERAGIAPGDTLLAYNGRDVRREEISMTRLLQPKSTVRVRVRREGKVRELPVVVADAPARIRIRRDEEIRDAMAPVLAGEFRAPLPAPLPPGFPRTPMPPQSAPGGVAPQRVMVPSRPVFEIAPGGVAGAQMVTVSESMKRSLGLPSGVLVTTVPIGSLAGESGLQEGDVIVRIGQQTVRMVHELREALAQASAEGERSLIVELRRGKERRSLALRW